MTRPIDDVIQLAVRTHPHTAVAVLQHDTDEVVREALGSRVVLGRRCTKLKNSPAFGADP